MLLVRKWYCALWKDILIHNMSEISFEVKTFDIPVLKCSPIIVLQHLTVFPGGHWPRKGVWGCAAVMTPFFQATWRSLAYQFTIIAPLLCPPFSNFRKISNFQPCFGQNFSSQDANFPNFRSLDPSFFKENPLPRPYFWKPVWHTPTKKKSWVPPPRDCIVYC